MDKLIKQRFCKRINNLELLTMSIEKSNDIKTTVHNVYKTSFAPRTVKGLGKADDNDINDILDELSNKIYEIFINNCLRLQDDIDTKIIDTSEWFVSEFNKSLPQGIEHICFGKAQKLVNMTIKYMYCFSDAEKFMLVFKQVHMPIDSYVLEWFKRAKLKSNKKNDGFSKCKTEANSCDKFEINKIPSWSNLYSGKDSSNNTYYDYDNKQKYTYYYFIKEMRNLLKKDYVNRNPNRTKKYEGMCLIDAEFLIWEDIQLELAVEDFILRMNSFNSVLINDKDDVKRYEIKKKLMFYPFENKMSIAESCCKKMKKNKERKLKSNTNNLCVAIKTGDKR